MIHEYDSVDAQVVWDTLTRDLPHLVSLIEALLQKKAF